MALLPDRSPPDLSARDSFRARRRRRLAGWIGWRYSLILVAALLAIGLVRFTGLGPEGTSTRTVAIRVTDGVSGKPIPGAVVELGGVPTTADGYGIARFTTGWQTQAVRVSAPGYAQAVGEVARSSANEQSVALLPEVSPATDASFPTMTPSSVPTPTAASADSETAGLSGIAVRSLPV